jgi:hypothetical protein
MKFRQKLVARSIATLTARSNPLSKTTSSCRPLQVTRLKKRVPDRWPSTGCLISSADRVAAASTRCRAITRATVRGSERDLDGYRQPHHRTLGSYRDVAA